MVELTASGDADQVEARLREWAVDLGKPGVDELFGHGRVDIRGAIAP